MVRGDEPTLPLGEGSGSASADSSDPLVGQRIADRYEVLAGLARGGFGRVFRARDVTLDRMVALKLIDIGPRAGDESRKRFLNEARANARLHHPHVVVLHDAGEDPRGMYLVLEYVAGTSLEDVLSAGPLEPARAVEILLECVEALAAAHSQGIVHRDIKPANILLTESGRVKVADFGIARLVGEARLTERGSIVGTPNYMAPEQIEGREVGPPADLFALGCVLYEMICGRPPFRGGTPSEVIGRILRGAPDPLPPLDNSLAPLVDLVAQLLQKRPAMRPKPDEVIERLRDWQRTAGDRRIGLRLRLGGRASAIAATIALVALLAVSVALFWKSGASDRLRPLPETVVTDASKPDTNAPEGRVRKSVAFSNRDAVFRFLEYLGKRRDGITRIDDLTIEIDGSAREVARRVEEAMLVDQLHGYRFLTEHSLFLDGKPSSRTVSCSIDSIDTVELIGLISWATGWPVVQSAAFVANADAKGPIKLEAKEARWDDVVQRVLDSRGSVAARYESAWLVVPKGAAVRQPARIVAVYQRQFPVTELAGRLEAPGSGRGVVLIDSAAKPPGVIVVDDAGRIPAYIATISEIKRAEWRVVEPRTFEGDPLSLRVARVELREVLSMLSQGEHAPLDPKITGAVTASVTDVPSDELLRIVLDGNALALDSKGRIVPPGGETALARETVRISRRPAGFYLPLGRRLGKEGGISVGAAGALVLTGSPEDVADVRRAIDSIERMLEAK